LPQSNVNNKDGNNIELLDWPGYSPNLNPIEKIWSWIKDEIYYKKIT
jgi:transposase